MFKTKNVEIEAWKKESLLRRMDKSRALLAAYGLLTKANNNYLYDRIRRMGRTEKPCVA